MLHGYVIMTNHIHLLFSTDEENSADVFMRDFKKWTTSQIQKELKNESRRYVNNLLEKTKPFSGRNLSISI
ncbi:MAG: transposase [Candidatus Anammoxibacter sp.]